MIISRTVTHPPLMIAATPSIGAREAEEHLARHGCLFGRFVSSLGLPSDEMKSVGHDDTACPRLSLRIEAEQIRLTSTQDPSRLTCGESYSFSVDLAPQITRSDILASVEQGALVHLASLHSRVLAMNKLECGGMHPWIRIKILMDAIEQDSHALCSTFLHAAERSQNRL